MTETTSQPRFKLSLAGGALGFNWLPIFVARDNDIFARLGLDVELRRLGSVDKATAAVRSGEADLAITPPEGALADAAAGGSLRLIAANCNCLPLTLVAKSSIKTVADLKGAVLGTSSLTEGTALYTRALLAQHGLDYPRDFSFSVVGVHQPRWKALQEGTIDAAVQPAPFNFLAIDAGYTDLGEVSDAIPEIAFTTMIGRLEWLEANSQTVLALLTAIAEATAMTYETGNDDMLVPIMMEVTQSDASYAKRALDYMRDKAAFARSLEIPSNALDTSLELMIAAGLLAVEDKERARAASDTRWARQAVRSSAH
jgi:ABC-type nitrate/sulfonate/bicarbonate transport system substrate-binding protein